MKDATRTLRQLGKRKLLPLKFSYHHFLLVLLIVINIALYASDYFWSDTQSTLISRSRLDQIDSLIRDYTKNRIEGQKGKKSRSPNNYTSELKKLRRKLQQGDIPRDQLITSLHRFLKAIQGNQADLANTLGAQLTAAKIEEMPVLNIPTLQNLSASQLQQLKMLLSQIPDTRVPDSTHRDIEILQQLQRLEKLLSQILDDFKEDAAALAESDRNQRPGSQSTNDLKKVDKDSQGSEIPGKVPGTHPNRESINQQPWANQSHGKMRELPKEPGSSNGYSSSAGQGKSSGKKNPRTKIEKIPGPGIQDTMLSSPMQKYLMHIRSLTAIGESRIEAEDIMRTYQQEIESILQKEDIPLNYREYIKHYFISIGLKTEENVHGFK